MNLDLEGNPADGRKISRNDVIRNNYIEKTGRDYYQTVGIMAGYTDGVVIEHNELHDMPYSGISVGWGWADQANAAQNNVVRYNRVWDVLNTMADGGAVHAVATAGDGPGGELRVRHCAASVAGGTRSTGSSWTRGAI